MWILPLCSSLVYGAMLMKAWRVYKIFETTSKIKKIIIKDLKLVGFICCLGLFDLAIVSFWYFYDPVQARPRYIFEKQSQQTIVNLNNNNNFDYNDRLLTPISASNIFLNNSTFINSTTQVLTSNLDNITTSKIIIQNLSYKNELKLVYECNSSLNEMWVSILTIYKIVLFMYGIYLAWIIRNINVPSMNDSKYLIVSTYVILVSGLGTMTLMQVLI